VTEIEQWLAAGPWPTDGALGSLLEERGYRLSDLLWSTTALIENPQAIAQVHRDYVAAGARVLTSASYQTSRQGFRAEGRSAADADAQILASLRLAQQAASQASDRVWVAASVGPYGAVLGGGQEYVGNYGLSHQQLVTFHRERLAVIAEGQPDLLACETVPDLREVAALLEALAEVPHIPAWITMSCRDQRTTCAGQPIAELANLVLGHPQVVAIGVNCSKPEYVSGLLGELAASAKGLPLVAYPNAGRVWDGARRIWLGDGAAALPSVAVQEWVGLGARLIGGCCGLGPAAIAAVASSLAELRSP
jgi:homocysteine S-methyltransferase